MNVLGMADAGTGITQMETSNMQMPNMQALRHEAIFAGAIDPMTLRFKIVEYCKWSGELLGIRNGNIGLEEAIHTTAGLIQRRQDSHFCLEPVGFIQ
jgi:hypothetical protein